MTPFFRLAHSWSRGIAAFRQTWNDQDKQIQPYRADPQHYARLWEFYSNTAYDDLREWARYKHRHGLYRYIRQIYNPTARLVEFYTSIYPGVLTTDARRVPDGTPLAIPLAADTPQEIRDALGVFWEWSNWQENMHVMLRYAGALGDVLVKINDETDRRRVSAQIMWPGVVDKLDLDSAGNVQDYALQYDVLVDNRTQVYREEVDPDRIRITLDGKPAPESWLGGPAVYANPYGFVPAVWYRFINLGGVRGAPVHFHSIGKIDEMNHLVSQIHDEIAKLLDAPIIIKGGKNVRTLNETIAGTRKAPTHELEYNETPKRDTLDVLYGPPDAGVETLHMDVLQALKAVESLRLEIEADHPELFMWGALRQMTQTTGPAVERLAGDVKARFVRAAAAADRQSVKLFQMGLAVAGYRATNGDWGGDLDYKREKFLPFDLGSYARGDLDFDIEMRPLLPEAKGDQYATEQARWTAWQQALANGMPLEMLLRKDGWDEEQIGQLIRDLSGPLAGALQQQKIDEITQQAKAQAAANPKPSSPTPTRG